MGQSPAARAQRGQSGMKTNLGEAGQPAQPPEGHPETFPT